MSAHVVLTLDTTAPAVVFGDATGTTAGEFLRIPYTSDEPLAVAVLIDAANVARPLAVEADHLSLLLPPDAADGWARVQWTDDVGNADEAVAVRLTGAVVEPPPGPPPPRPPAGLPSPRVPTRQRLRARSTIVCRTTSRIRRTERRERDIHRQVTTIVTTTRRRRTQLRIAPGLRGSVLQPLTVTTRSAIRANALTTSALTVNSTAHIRRRDDPEIEAILLGLL